MGEEQWREAFDMHDLDGASSISSKDLAACLRYCGAVVSNAEVAKVAGDKSTISWEEFKKILADALKKHPAGAGLNQKVKDHFKVFDKDEDGFVQTSELNYIMGKVAEKLTGEEMEVLNNESGQFADQGKIKYREFIDHMMQNVK
eukprot:TRINITY_DN918_c0_g1_i1.p1 TRINITY_DN918_c0_g1~~TRINITY_DN918_c0_g1_i1.p1  ORF type:complete len:145 (-),score=51.68 TRINITY_DN918_c0_g1_i1:117-551(-)